VVLFSTWAGLDWFVPALITIGALCWALATPRRLEPPLGYGELAPALRRTTSLMVSIAAWAIYLAIHAAA
jgi:hypothetical protein